LSEQYENPSKISYITLIFVNFAAWPISLVVSLLLLDIGKTFGANIGITGQLQTLSSGISVLSALILGGLSTRFRNENLLKTGLIIIALSALGCAYAQSFQMIFIIYGLAGIGITMVSPMSRALVGNLFPPEQRTKALAWLTTGVTISYIVGARANSERETPADSAIILSSCFSFVLNLKLITDSILLSMYYESITHLIKVILT